MKRAASQHVNVQVKNCLPCAGARVDDGAIALGIESPLPRQLARHEKKMSKQRRIIGLSLHKGGNVLARDHQQVNGRLGMDVFKGDGAVILMDDSGGNFSIQYPAKEAIFH